MDKRSLGGPDLCELGVRGVATSLMTRNGTKLQDQGRTRGGNGIESLGLFRASATQASPPPRAQQNRRVGLAPLPFAFSLSFFQVFDIHAQLP
jgi:hypothetical protein